MPTTRIVASWDETPHLRGIEMETGPLASAYRVPGQYARIELPAGKAYFAFASAPDNGRAAILVKRGTDVADALCALEPGTTLEISEPMGAGFPVDRVGERPLLLFATGSGVGPMRAVIDHLRARPHGRILLFYGQRTEAELAYARERAQWQREGVEVICACSRADGPSRGYVQDALLATKPDVTAALAFLCGRKEMVAAVRATLESLGLPASETFLNY